MGQAGQTTGAGTIRIGTSGWIYPHWRGVFYPARMPVRLWFAFYAERFDSVEINNTFYRLPGVNTFETWRRQAPAGFLYAVKASRFLTHMKKLREPVGPLANILGRARALGPTLGPVLYQLPPHWHCDLERLREFIAQLPADLTHVFEFRDPTWCNEQVRELLARTRMSFCIHDMPGFPCPAWVTGPAAYVRFHGPGEAKYGGRYDTAHLRDWATRIRDFSRAGHAVYAYFNNDLGGHAVANAAELKALV